VAYIKSCLVWHFRKMRSRLLGFRSAAAVSIGLALFAGAPLTPQTGESPVLARVELGAVWPDLPLYAVLQDGTGRDYALAVAARTRLSSSGAVFRVLDANAKASDYVIALERRAGARRAADRAFPVLEDDGRHIIVRLLPGREAVLSDLGFDLQRLEDEPLVIRAAVPVEVALRAAPDPTIATIIARVQSATVSDYIAQLSGAKAASVGGSSYTFATRHTNSGTPIAKATQFVYERLAALGLTVSYHDWSAGGYSNRNVVGERTGTVSPGEIVLVTAHVDDLPSGSTAPGADDNGSGSVAVWIAAEVLGRYSFQRTLRFVFFTGEEQGLYGSSRYAAAAAGRGDNIVGVLNLDMIAWDSLNGPTLRLHTRSSSNPGSTADATIANAFVSVVSTYGLGSVLTPIVTSDGESASDHGSFWNRGYPGILAIEDDLSDFNPYYHKVTDVASVLNTAYFTNFVKAAVGTVAVLAGPVRADAPLIGLSRKGLAFGASGGVFTSAQSVRVDNAGAGNLTWTAASNAAWLNVAPASGTNAGVIQVSVNPAGLAAAAAGAAGSYNGAVTVSDPNAVNNPQTIAVALTTYAGGATAGPFGEFATPADGTAGIAGAIPVTGWVLDDIETTGVKIWRDPAAGEGPSAVFIGDAIFVEGARPDVETAYPAYPFNGRAGWGYMLLTNFLPARGNGTFRIHAFAADKDGHEILLGSKTITCDNAHAVKPFGTIDTPAQGGEASGAAFPVFGWVLTPMPKTVPKDGSTITVWIDGVELGDLSSPPNVYDQYRSDVSGLFPGLNNSDGPVGAYFLDTTKYANGVHSIHWIATDNAGQADGIGSRYFNILNSWIIGDPPATGKGRERNPDSGRRPGDSYETVLGFVREDGSGSDQRISVRAAIRPKFYDRMKAE